MKKLFVFDVDGTLVNTERNVQPSSILALETAYNQGNEIAIVTGRNFNEMDDVLTSLPCVRFIATLNGGIVRDLTYDKLFTFTKPINRDLVREFIEIAQRVQREFQCYNNEEAYYVYFGTDPKKDITDESFFLGGNKHTTYSKWDDVKDRILNGEFYHISIKAEYPIIEREFAILNEKYKDSKEFSIVTASTCFIGCDPYGISKDGAIKFIQELTNIENKDTFFFGDSGNDIKALDYVANSVAMGNAKSYVKQHAKYIIGDHDTDAIHDFVMNVLKYE